MAGGGKAYPTPDELIATIKRSAFPNLIIEGHDDIIALRDIEAICGDVSLQLLAAGGRSTVIEIFRRRGELAGGPLVLFFVDKDLWVHGGKPIEFCHEHFLTTDGYSIENDIYRDGALERLLSNQEVLSFKRELDRFLDWYALALSRTLTGRAEKLDINPARVFHPLTRSALTDLRKGEVFPQQMKMRHFNRYKKILRGKSLMQLLLRQLSHAGRNPKFSRCALVQIGGTARGAILSRLFNAIANKVGSSGTV